jgi:hypothetical protein
MSTVRINCDYDKNQRKVREQMAAVARGLREPLPEKVQIKVVGKFTPAKKLKVKPLYYREVPAEKIPIKIVMTEIPAEKIPIKVIVRETPTGPLCVRGIQPRGKR